MSYHMLAPVIAYVIFGCNLKYVERPLAKFNDRNYACVRE